MRIENNFSQRAVLTTILLVAFRLINMPGSISFWKPCRAEQISGALYITGVLWYGTPTIVICFDLLLTIIVSSLLHPQLLQFPTWARQWTTPVLLLLHMDWTTAYERGVECIVFAQVCQVSPNTTKKKKSPSSFVLPIHILFCSYYL